jgi:LmbE family N-acetylglucosaminyl deacetylase
MTSRTRADDREVSRPRSRGRKHWLLAMFAACFLIISGIYIYLQTPILWFVSIKPGIVPTHDEAGPERIMVVAPHPDDGILGVGGTMAEAVAAGASVLVVYLTDGDANRAARRVITMNPFHIPAQYRALGARRQKEAVLALRRLGLDSANAVFLNYPDRGLTPLLESHWSPVDPYRSRFTNRDAKYSPQALNPTADYCGERLVEDLAFILRGYQPTILYLPHPEDAHPDHHAGYRAAMLALEASASQFVPPDIRCYMVHLFEERWPVPGGVNVALPLSVFPAPIAAEPWHSVVLPEWAGECGGKAVPAELLSLGG